MTGARVATHFHSLTHSLGNAALSPRNESGDRRDDDILFRMCEQHPSGAHIAFIFYNAGREVKEFGHLPELSFYLSKEMAFIYTPDWQGL